MSFWYQMKTILIIGGLADTVDNKDNDIGENIVIITNPKNVFKNVLDVREHVKICCPVCFLAKKWTGIQTMLVREW